jgi:hypothetical protein
VPCGRGSPNTPPLLRAPLRPIVQLLGRAENLKDYVQRGCDEAWTEITLSGGRGQTDMVIRRDIKQVSRDDGATGYSSKWKLNSGWPWIRGCVKVCSYIFRYRCPGVLRASGQHICTCGRALEAGKRAHGAASLFN